MEKLEAATTRIEDGQQIRESFRRFITQAMTFRKVNTDEWVEWFETEAIAAAKQALQEQLPERESAA